MDRKSAAEKLTSLNLEGKIDNGKARISGLISVRDHDIRKALAALDVTDLKWLTGDGYTITDQDIASPTTYLHIHGADTANKLLDAGVKLKNQESFRQKLDNIGVTDDSPETPVRSGR